MQVLLVLLFVFVFCLIAVVCSWFCFSAVFVCLFVCQPFAQIVIYPFVHAPLTCSDHDVLWFEHKMSYSVFIS